MIPLRRLSFHRHRTLRHNRRWHRRHQFRRHRQDRLQLRLFHRQSLPSHH